MPTLKLTKKATDTLQPEDKTVYYYDTVLTGFFLRITKTGAKSWGYEYRIGSGRGAKKRRITIGNDGRITVARARALAEKAAAEVTEGGDPAGDKTERAAEITIADLIDLYEAEGCFVLRGKRMGEPMKALTKRYTLARLRNHVVPLIGKSKISDVQHKDIEKLNRDIADGKTSKSREGMGGRGAKASGGEGIARKVVRDLSAVFTFAIRRGLVKDNPVTNAAVRKTDNKRERYLSIAELERLGAVLREMESEGVSPKAIKIIRLLALTGCRRNEISSLKWREVDLERGMLVLEDTKTGRSLRPLGQAAWDMLREQSQQYESEYVFPASTGNGSYQGLGKIWQQARRRAKLDDVTLHSLRHTVGSTAVSMGESLQLTGAILGHANPRSTAIYAHIQTDPLKEAADRVSDNIKSALKMC